MVDARRARTMADDVEEARQAMLRELEEHFHGEEDVLFDVAERFAHIDGLEGIVVARGGRTVRAFGVDRRGPETAYLPIGDTPPDAAPWDVAGERHESYAVLHFEVAAGAIVPRRAAHDCFDGGEARDRLRYLVQVAVKEKACRGFIVCAEFHGQD